MIRCHVLESRKPDDVVDPDPVGFVDIVMGVDARYSEVLSVALASVVRHRVDGDRYRIWILAAAEASGAAAEWRRIGESQGAVVQMLLVDRGLLLGVPVSGHISEASYFRVLAPALLPGEVGRYIYLDCDVVVETALGKLYREDLEGRVIGAVGDVLIRWNRLPGVRRGTPYFNAGVMVVDRIAWERAGLGEVALRRLRERPEVLKFHDQDLLNWVVEGNWKQMDARWNQQSAMWEIGRNQLARVHPDPEALLNAPHVIHFSGFSKPWEYSCDHPLRDRYRDCRGMAGLCTRPPVATSFKEVVRKAAKSVVGFRLRFLVRAVLRGFKKMGNIQTGPDRT